MNRRSALARVSTALVGALCPTAWAQSYPSKPIKLVNPFSAGSPVDVVARPIAQRLSDLLRQPVTVDNRAGAGGAIGAEFVAKAAPDGYTLLVSSSSTHVIGPLLKRNLPYHPSQDFTPLAMIADGPTAVVVHPSLPVENLREFIAYAGKNPNAVAYGSSGPGTLLHISGAVFAAKTRVQLLHVPYRGAVPASTDLVGGQIQVMFDSITNASANVRTGRLRALAVLSAERSPLMPGVSTATEQGFDGLALPAWVGFFAPAGISAEASNHLTAALATITSERDVQARLIASGMLPRYLGRREFETEMAQERQLLSGLFQEMNLKIE